MIDKLDRGDLISVGKWVRNLVIKVGTPEYCYPGSERKFRLSIEKSLKKLDKPLENKSAQKDLKALIESFVKSNSDIEKELSIKLSKRAFDKRRTTLRVQRSVCKELKKIVKKKQLNNQSDAIAFLLDNYHSHSEKKRKKKH